MAVDIENRRILVSESLDGQVKDREPRVVPIQDALLPILRSWKVKTGGKGLVIPPMRCDASQWAMAGGNLRELQTILGHASITETERYAHLVPGHFSAGARSTLRIDLTAGSAEVGTLEPRMAHATEARRSK